MWLKPRLEHVNITVRDPDATANLMTHLFGWRRRWAGPAKNNGYTVHVGTASSYLALYRPEVPLPAIQDPDSHVGVMTHIGVQVRHLPAVESKVERAGYRPHGHNTTAPGRRFYFREENGIEFEVLSYARPGRNWSLFTPIGLATMLK